MAQTVASVLDNDQPVARPLRVLVPLIREDLQQAKAASERASMPFYAAAGAKLLEAKNSDGMSYSEWCSWTWKNFKVKENTAKVWIKYYEQTRISVTPEYRSLDDFRRRHLDEKRVPGSRRDQDWRGPIKNLLGDVDVKAMRQANLKQAEERKLERELALQLIDIGYKALATKLHPDKGGSPHAMTRLNAVRNRLKQCS